MCPSAGSRTSHWERLGTCRCQPGNSRKGLPDSRRAGRPGSARPWSRRCSRWPMRRDIRRRSPTTAALRAPFRSTSAVLRERREGGGSRGSPSPVRCRSATSRCGRDRCARGRAWERPSSLAVATGPSPWPRRKRAPTPATFVVLHHPGAMRGPGLPSRSCRRSRLRSRCGFPATFSPWSAEICGFIAWVRPRRNRSRKVSRDRSGRRSPGRSIPDRGRRWSLRLSTRTLLPPCSRCGRQWAFMEGRRRCTSLCVRWRPGCPGGSASRRMPPRW